MNFTVYCLATRMLKARSYHFSIIPLDEENDTKILELEFPGIALDIYIFVMLHEFYKNYHH